MVKVNFSIQYHTHPGQNVRVVGSVPSLGSWDVAKAFQLNYKDGHWTGMFRVLRRIRHMLVLRRERGD